MSGLQDAYEKRYLRALGLVDDDIARLWLDRLERAVRDTLNGEEQTVLMVKALEIYERAVELVEEERGLVVSARLIAVRLFGDFAERKITPGDFKKILESAKTDDGLRKVIVEQVGTLRRLNGTGMSLQ